MKSKKIFILLPDGVGLRNFAFTSFVEVGSKKGWKVVFWNGTPFELSALSYNETKLQAKPRTFTDILKRAKINAELNYFNKKYNDSVYEKYKFPSSWKGLKAKVKNLIVLLFTAYFRNENGLDQLRKRMKESERGSKYYTACKSFLEDEKPDFIFCTNQRPVNAIAPLTAAQDLGIPTGSFISSWDNLPKATLIVEPDHYFVWSEFMKKELLDYYSFIDPSNVHVTGTPQFEPHFDSSLLEPKEVFFKKYNLDEQKEYICFSGDDVTTSPHDEIYLRDVAEAVRALNSTGENFGIIFRRCPVDFSNRYDDVIQEYKDVIQPIDPLWKSIGTSWNSVLPLVADLKLQYNIIAQSLMVINIASSMVFDFASHGKPCAYINYVPAGEPIEKDIREIYGYVHFRSMPAQDVVLWINSKEKIVEVIKKVRYKDVSHTAKGAQQWFKLINQHPPQLASERIWEKLEKIT